MQTQHPSPIDGFFEPAATLGEAVEAGQPIGKVFPAGAGEPHVACAAESGILAMLRALPSVRRGDALAAIASHFEEQR